MCASMIGVWTAMYAGPPQDVAPLVSGLVFLGIASAPLGTLYLGRFLWKGYYVGMYARRCDLLEQLTNKQQDHIRMIEGNRDALEKAFNECNGALNERVQALEAEVDRRA